MSDDLVNRLRDERTTGAMFLRLDAAQALTEARAEIDRLREWKQNQLVHWPMEIERRNQELAAAESELSTLRARTAALTSLEGDAIERVARTICQSGKFETGQGTCAVICMDQLGDVRKKGCGHCTRVHGAMARAILASLEGDN